MSALNSWKIREMAESLSRGLEPCIAVERVYTCENSNAIGLLGNEINYLFYCINYIFLNYIASVVGLMPDRKSL